MFRATGATAGTLPVRLPLSVYVEAQGGRNRGACSYHAIILEDWACVQTDRLTTLLKLTSAKAHTPSQIVSTQKMCTLANSPLGPDSYFVRARLLIKMLREVAEGGVLPMQGFAPLFVHRSNFARAPARQPLRLLFLITFFQHPRHPSSHPSFVGRGMIDSVESARARIEN